MVCLEETSAKFSNIRTSPREFKISTLTLNKFDSKSILIKSLLGFGYKLIGALTNSFKPIPSS